MASLGMKSEDMAKIEGFRSIVDEYRPTCFWSFKKDFSPENPEQMLMAAEALECYGDMAAFRKAGEIREWVSRQYR